MAAQQFEAAVARAAELLGPARAERLAGMLAGARGLDYILLTLAPPAPDGERAVRRLHRAAEAAGLPPAEAGAYLRGYAAAAERLRGEVEVSTVWSGPSTPPVPVRATAQVLAEVIGEARTELLAVTYAARARPELTRALTAAAERGVRVDIVVETLAGAHGLLGGPEPAAAFAGLPAGVRLWEWPSSERLERRAVLHAKLAVADREVLFLGSANLTESGTRRNLEAGVLIRGGSAPVRAAEHLRELQRRGVLRELPATVGQTATG
jgi:phosphatidylserine/phosphatidylglycerophosphate/cardiolipin synthase-like enzyme